LVGFIGHLDKDYWFFMDRLEITLVVFMDKDMVAINWFFYAYWILGSMGTVKNEPGKFLKKTEPRKGVRSEIEILNKST
jgi:hypothetical protein